MPAVRQFSPQNRASQLVAGMSPWGQWSGQAVRVVGVLAQQLPWLDSAFVGLLDDGLRGRPRMRRSVLLKRLGVCNREIAHRIGIRAFRASRSVLG